MTWPPLVTVALIVPVPVRDAAVDAEGAAVDGSSVEDRRACGLGVGADAETGSGGDRHRPGIGGVIEAELPLLDLDRAGVGERDLDARRRAEVEQVNVPALLKATAEPSPVDDRSAGHR